VDAHARDRALRRMRIAAWSLGAGAAALAGGLSALAAQAFKGHTGKPAQAPRAPVRAAAPVPPPQSVPPISGDAAPLAPPAEPPAAEAPSQPAAPPEPPAAVSGGS
jgi:hypothetical protein